MPFVIILLLVVLAAGAYGYRRWSKARARAALLASPLTEAEREIIAQEVPITRRLPGKLRAQLEGRINLFLDQIEFIGCNGLDVTEAMRLSIAAQACLLIVNSGTWYRNLRTILIYPGAFKSRQQKHNGYVVTEHETVRTGESWARGPVILSWQHSEQGALDDSDGHNVVLHEFAHQVDDLSGRADGAPVLAKGQSFAEYARVFVGAYERHLHAVQHGHHTVIDPYGAEGQEEFFAVAVELFFERPSALKSDEPEVYEQLAELFRLDPISWG
ncbi:M90 family metallopeptidase [Vannielia sp.]|uniref:M90 family metallopeptidase n=1 Tax=Vannielia sp. TaxID=2813045 RepID=UPI00263732DD|nr:M90 family metallopeptidase [Vannielia sp.]MDF1872363.1 zinc-dependent peptidase [Vannielia sp.]